jgi:hypothetical protein
LHDATVEASEYTSSCGDHDVGGLHQNLADDYQRRFASAELHVRNIHHGGA